MNHLIYFRESNKYLSLKKMIDDINYICTDIIDDGFSIRVYPDNDIRIKVMSLKSDDVFTDRNFEFYVKIFRKIDSIFDIDDVSETLISLVEYMEYNGYKCKLIIPNPGNYSKQREIDIMSGSFPDIGYPKRIVSIKIDFTKD